jgi:hypothetical protein
VFLTTPAPFHDLGSLIFRDNTLHLKQQVVFRALSQRPVQEDDVDPGAMPLIDQ